MARVIKSITKQFYLAKFNSQYVHGNSSFAPRVEPAFVIIRELAGPEIPSDMQDHYQDYFVLEVVRKFRVTAHQAPTVFTTEELK